MQHYFAHRQQGFTLIEIIIVAVIMMIVVAGSIAAFVGFQDRQTALVAAKDVQQLMRTAQTKARARETPSGCNPLNGYQVVVAADSSSLAPMCNGASGLVIQRINHPGLATDGAGTYLFHTLEGGVTTPNGTPINTTTLIFKSGATTYSFSISATGAISNVTSSAGNTDL